MSAHEAQTSATDPGGSPRGGGAEAAPAAGSERPGDRVGPYVLLELLGEGGFGTVWMAERREPIVQRVALKVMKPGMDSRAVIARFEQERQALAVMDHPNVAKVSDAGTAESGRPYFVMELVRGDPLTAYCDRNRLSVRARLELFIPVCEAVQHAHMKGIIHRDLKPSNILVEVVEGRPVPKVIDFGVAKAITHTLTDKTIFTETGQLIGTPEYMSPEQAEMGATDIDTRTDVYSLGAVLYELLTGALPLDARTLRSAGYDALRRMIRESEPARPSRRLSTLLTGAADADAAVRIAAERATTLDALRRELRRELEWIPLMALRKDRTQRYVSAAAMAGDIRRYLEHLPLEAGPESAGYRARKFVRRHRVGVFAGLAVAAAVVAGVAATVTFAMRESEALRATQELAWFQGDVLNGFEPLEVRRELRRALEEDARLRFPDENAGDRVEKMLDGLNLTNVGVRVIDQSILARAESTARERFADQPWALANVLQTVAQARINLGLTSAARAGLEEVLEIRRRHFDREDIDTYRAVRDLAHLASISGRHEEAEKLFAEVIEARRRILGEDHPETLYALNDMGNALTAAGRLDQAESCYRRALEGMDRVLRHDDRTRLACLGNLGSLLGSRGQREEAERLLREVLDRRKAIFGEDHRETVTAKNNLALLLHSMDRLDEAEPMMREAFESARRVYGDDHADTVTIAAALAQMTLDGGDARGAERMLREWMERSGAVLGPEHLRTVYVKAQLVSLVVELGRGAEVEGLAREVVAFRRRHLGVSHFETISAMNNLGSLLYQQGRFAEARPLLYETMEAQRATLGPDHVDTLNAINSYAALLRGMGLAAEALRFNLESVEGHTRVLGPDHWRTANARLTNGRTLAALARYAEATAELVAAEPILRHAALAPYGRHALCVRFLAEMYEQWDAAEPGKGHDVEARTWRDALAALPRD